MIIESEERAGLSGQNLYQRMRELEEELEFLSLQEDFILKEKLSLKREILRSKEELKKIKSTPLLIGQFVEIVDDEHGIISANGESLYMVRIMSTVDRELLKPNQSIALHKHSLAIVDVLPTEADVNI